MEIHQLRYFCAVAQTGSFTKAAEQEGIAQPSLSQQIVRLETSLGARLFDRLGRGVRLTESGKTLLPQALEILRQVAGARTSVESLQRGVAGRLTVGCIPTIMPYFLAPSVSRFAAAYPDVELRLLEDITPNLVVLLQTGEIDVAIVSPPVHNPDVVCSDLFREPILVAINERHRLAEDACVSFRDLDQERLLLLKEGHCFRDNALTVCTRARTDLQGIFETDQFSSILPLVAAGFGISLIPQMAAQSGSGCVFLQLDREAYRRVGYMRVRRHSAGTAQKAFIKWIRQISSERA
ncbi:MAG: LysR family transcriptional regulator [Bryobacterales bacterium]|jgi:LysR family transcriptional regulator, hydrogen peroxide-inducible genes activator|nr:LysR family transcriptional regulator [Bryobacterales bacterium]